MNTVWITGDGYTDESRFIDDASMAMRALTSDPEVGHVVRRMRTRTIHTASGSGTIPSGQSGDTAFGVYVHPTGNFRLNVGGVLSWRTAKGVGYHDVVLLLVNSSRYGGAYNATAKVAYVSARNAHSPEVLRHEFLGHAIAGLGDEYASGGTYQGGGTSSPNLDTENDPALVKWARLIGRDDGMGGSVGVFEGGGDYSRGIYRPTATSRMRQLHKPWGPVNAEAIIVAAGRFIPRLEGDLNGDGRVDFDDLNLALRDGDFDRMNDVLSNYGRDE